MKQLDDPTNDVQSIAVKCLAILVKKVQEAQICDICDKLVSLIVNPDKGELRYAQLRIILFDFWKR